MNADDLLARVFGALETFITHFHASLILIVRAVSTVTLDTSGVTRQFAFHFDMAMNNRHNKPPENGEARETPRNEQARALEGKNLEYRPRAILGAFAHGSARPRANCSSVDPLDD